MLPFNAGSYGFLFMGDNMVQNNGNRSRWYLNVIITIVMIFLALIAWSMQDALARNRRDHEVIKDDLRELSALVMTFVKNAPPNHVHLPNGGVARIVPDH